MRSIVFAVCLIACAKQAPPGATPTSEEEQRSEAASTPTSPAEDDPLVEFESDFDRWVREGLEQKSVIPETCTFSTDYSNHSFSDPLQIGETPDGRCYLIYEIPDLDPSRLFSERDPYILVACLLPNAPCVPARASTFTVDRSRCCALASVFKPKIK